MAEILVLAEHRGGALREVTFEALGLARQLSEAGGYEVVALLLEGSSSGFAGELAQAADRVSQQVAFPGRGLFKCLCFGPWLAQIAHLKHGHLHHAPSPVDFLRLGQKSRPALSQSVEGSTLDQVGGLFGLQFHALEQIP